MLKSHMAALAAVAMFVGSGALAQEPATSAWGSVYAPPTALERQVDLNAAELIELQRTGGLTSITNIGTLNSTTTYNGSVTNTSANSTTIGNSNSTHTSVDLSGAVDSMVVITTSTDQSSDNLNQTAGSTTTTNTPRGE